MPDQPPPPTSIDELTLLPTEILPLPSTHTAGWVAAMNVRFVRATIDEVTAELKSARSTIRDTGLSMAESIPA